MTSKGEDDGGLEEKEEKQVISLGRKREPTLWGLLFPQERSLPFGDQTLVSEDGRGQPHCLWCGRPGSEAERWGAGGGGRSSFLCSSDPNSLGPGNRHARGREPV